jgi:hypothetical protein
MDMGDEGSVRLLGRMWWRCDACNALVYDDDNEETA